MDTQACKLTVQTRRHLRTQCASVISAHSPARVNAATRSAASAKLRFWLGRGLGIRDGRKDLGGFVAWSVSILKAGRTI